jgi:exonuclease III
LVEDTLKQSKAIILCLQETKLNDISFTKLNSIVPPSHSNHTYIPGNGSQGGTLTAWVPSLNLNQSYNLTFSNTVILTNTLGMSFMITSVYGPVDNARKNDFLTKIRTIYCLNDLPWFLMKIRTIYCLNDLPWLLLGDFNIIRELSDTTAANPNTHSMLAFNTLIADLKLQELTLFDRQYT